MAHADTVGNRELLRIKNMIKKRPFDVAEPINWMVFFDDAILNSGSI